MVNKQFRITTDTLSPLFKASVGFDNLVSEFFNEPAFNNNATGYPPFNISKTKDDVYEITLAIAGFKKSDIEIEYSGQDIEGEDLSYSVYTEPIHGEIMENIYTLSQIEVIIILLILRLL